MSNRPSTRSLRSVAQDTSPRPSNDKAFSPTQLALSEAEGRVEVLPASPQNPNFCVTIYAGKSYNKAKQKWTLII
jgi:hypothetical protein